MDLYGDGYGGRPLRQHWHKSEREFAFFTVKWNFVSRRLPRLLGKIAE